MIRRDVPIVNKLGLHARAASHLVKTASDFKSRVTVERAGASADAKSIMGLMLLAGGVAAAAVAGVLTLVTGP
jgi:phosphocarrier protein